MIKKNFLGLLLFTLFIGFSFPLILLVNGDLSISLNSGKTEIVEKKFQRNFQKIQIGVNSQVFISQSEKNSIRLEGNSNRLNQIEIQETSKTLQIKKNDKNHLYLNPAGLNQPLKIFISINDFNELEIDSNIDTQIEIGTFSFANLSIFGDFSGSILGENIEIEDNLTIDNGGTGFLRFRGKTKNLNLITRDIARIQFRAFNAENVNIKASGDGGIEVSASQNLNIKSTGSSPIKYKGNPKLQTEVSQESRIERI